MPNRVYCIKYKLYLPKGGAFKYALKPEYENHVEYFDKTERDKFIDRFLYLKKKDLEVDDIRCFVADLEPIEDMNSVINAI